MPPPIKSRLHTSCAALHFVTTKHSNSEITQQPESTSFSFFSFHNNSDIHPLRTTYFPLYIYGPTYRKKKPNIVTTIKVLMFC